MNRQTLQAKESAPAKKKSSFSWLRPAAAHPAAEAEHEAPSASSPAFAHDFTKVPVRPMQLPGVPGFSCPFAPQRCPSGGACHTCPPKMQAKLKIGQPGDRYEQEADRVAETVMRMPEPQVQRKGCSAPGCKDEDEDKLVQTKSAGSAGNAQVDHPLIQSVLSSPGQPLDAGTRSFMEPRFGQDFSGVRVHVGGQAAESARAVNARAYTVGRDVVFGEGQYAPGSGEGRRLVAHELVHVGQQSKNTLQRYDDDKLDAGVPLPGGLPEEPQGETSDQNDNRRCTCRRCTCTPASGILNNDCTAYSANSWWLPLAYVNNATCACSATPNSPTANCVRKFLQDRLAATPSCLKSDASAQKHLESSWNPLEKLKYKKFVLDSLTPVIYKDHVDAYASCCCPSGPAHYLSWRGVTTIPIPSCWAVGQSISWFGSCHGTLGTW